MTAVRLWFVQARVPSGVGEERGAVRALSSSHTLICFPCSLQCMLTMMTEDIQARGTAAGLTGTQSSGGPQHPSEGRHTGQDPANSQAAAVELSAPSSMVLRHPCIAATPYCRLGPSPSSTSLSVTGVERYAPMPPHQRCSTTSCLCSPQHVWIEHCLLDAEQAISC